MKIEIDPTPPTAETFFRSRHYSNENEDVSASQLLGKIAAFETEHGLRLPAELRALYERQNGGHTEFQYLPATDKPDYVFEGVDPYPAFERSWRTALVDNDLYPLETIRTFGWFSDQIDFDDEWSWRHIVDDADRILVINSHGSDFFLCLDYRENPDMPKVCLIAQSISGDAFEAEFVYDSFSDFFNALRARDD